MILHLSMLLSFSLVGVIAPIVIWQIKKEQYPILDAHGRNAANFMLSMFIYGIVCALLCVAFIVPDHCCNQGAKWRVLEIPIDDDQDLLVL